MHKMRIGANNEPQKLVFGKVIWSVKTMHRFAGPDNLAKYPVSNMHLW